MRFALLRSPLSPRRESGAHRKSTRARSLILGTGSALALTGLIVGVGAVAQASVSSSASIAATTELSESTGLRHEQLSVYAVIATKTAHEHAKSTLNEAGEVIGIMANKVDSTPLATSVAALSDYKTLETDAVIELTEQTQAASEAARSAVAEVDRIASEEAAVAAAESSRLAAEAAAEAEESARADAAESARAADAAPTAQGAAGGNSPGEAQATARAMAASNYGWGESEFSCLVQLWDKESGWSYTAYNPSGATGIPQALPGSKMATAGSDWATNATTQIAWGLGYIEGGYGSPCGAWAHSVSNNWY
ncbi:MULTISPECIES: hypothetical protein [Cryobacterium]|uniref:Phospholipase n=1 Tax=Cryobacterium breve TaxID=1259258 RepID=A0ABY2IYU3_9MICO|nr:MULTISPECIES: hypothetical protein [Cryobacterium]TFC96827.1 hypothetical protein E3T20_02170 [Cryobacterium sp. TmT3-12]TFC97377.1 hypothetical protein E3O65_11335 [Cryobacterium breve]